MTPEQEPSADTAQGVSEEELDTWEDFFSQAHRREHDSLDGCAQALNVGVGNIGSSKADELTFILGLIRIYRRTAAARPDTKTWRDEPLPEDDAIKAAHPTNGGSDALYMEATRLVGARRSKAGLVCLVNWLLHERAARPDAPDHIPDASKMVAESPDLVKGDRLLPCPFCGERPQLTTHEGDDEIPDDQQWECAVVCKAHDCKLIVMCQGFGRDRETAVTEAMGRWNRRPAPAPSVSQMGDGWEPTQTHPTEDGSTHMPSNTDVSLTIIGGPDTALTFSLITSFEASQDYTNLKVIGLDGVTRYDRLPHGWKGSFELERTPSGPLDDYFAQAETRYFSGGGTYSATITETISEPNGGLSQFRYEGVALKVNSASGSTGSDGVKQKVSFMAPRRRKVI